MAIRYFTEHVPEIDDIVKLYSACFLENPRPTDDIVRLSNMIQSASLLCTAYDNNTLVGMCRALSDFSYVTYISDLAVLPGYQRKNIGRNMLNIIEKNSESVEKIVLLSSQSANSYYPHLKFKPHQRAWVKIL